MGYGSYSDFGQGGYGGGYGLSNEQIDQLMSLPDDQFSNWLSSGGYGGYGGPSGAGGYAGSSIGSFSPSSFSFGMPDSGIGGTGSSSPWDVGKMLTAAGGIGTAIGGLSSLFSGSPSGGSVTQSSTLSPEQAQLYQLQAQLSARQLANIDQMQPYQQLLLQQSMSQLKSQQAYQDALDKAITPEQYASQQVADYNQNTENQANQSKLLKMQMDQLAMNGAATPEQLARIKEATDSAITAGSSDIDVNTQRGISMIADELANSRGLRLSDTPIGSEAALLARAGSDQKASLVNNLRAGQASSTLSYPLQVQQLQGGINLAQQSSLEASKQFQDQLRQQAYTNRLSLVSPTSSTGLGLSGMGASAIPKNETITRSATGSLSDNLTNVGSIFQGAQTAYPAIKSIFGY